ncbi:MAG: aquaporin family protein [Planctomycetes bacterium]|nr:aquaporin family protein [Planctomycetota bacterium]
MQEHTPTVRVEVAPGTEAGVPAPGSGAAHAAERPLYMLCLAEVLGTYLLILFGLGAVHSAVLTGSQSGLWQVAIIWGISIMLAVYTVGAISGAHINPAITVALAAWGRFSWRLVGPYVLAQVVGAFLAAATLFVLYGNLLEERERTKGVTRGAEGSEITAMCYGEYFPNPGPLATSSEFYSATKHAEFRKLVSHPVAFLAEVIGTLVLALVVFAVTDEGNSAGPTGRLGPAFIGLCVAALISIIAPLTQACFNPARDFGPRLFACLAGWGSIALPGADGISWLTVYIIAPTVGAVVGGALYERVLKPSITG